MSTTTAGTTVDFSLVRGDVLYRLQRAIGLIPANGLGLVRRALFWSMLGWLPVALWALYINRALPGALNEPLLSHFGVHARLLVAVPLLIFAEGPASALIARLLRHFVESGIVPPTQRTAFDDALRERRPAARRHDALDRDRRDRVRGAAVRRHGVPAPRNRLGPRGRPGRGPGFGGLWYLYVGRSIYFTLLFGWLWRIVLLVVLMRRVARLELALVPTHPDRAAGLGFLERLPGVFAPLALAVGAVLASRWAHDAVYHGLTLRRCASR